MKDNAIGKIRVCYLAFLATAFLALSLAIYPGVAFADESPQTESGDQSNGASIITENDRSNNDENSEEEGDVPIDEESSTLSPGWNKVGGGWLYADANGQAMTGWLDKSGKHYYLSPENGGEMATGWREIEGARYYFRSSGEMATGWVQSNGSWYYLKSTGAMTTGWVKDGGAWYWLDPADGGAMATGWVEDGGERYYLKSSGAMATGWVEDGGSWYWLQSSGAQATGWLSEGSTRYWLDPAKGGKMATGWQDIEGERYYFKSSGAMATSWVTVDGNRHFFNSSGIMATGWLDNAGERYYLDPETGTVATGIFQIEEVTYVADENGALACEEWVTLSDGAVYFTDSTGSPSFEGHLNTNGDCTLQDEEGNTLYGWLNFDGVTFYGDPNGDGALMTGWFKIDGKWYWANQNYVVQKGLTSIGNNKYFLDPAENGAMATGWQEIDGRRYFFAETGAMAIKWVKWDGDWYYMNATTGAMCTGWQEILPDWYYFDNNGKMVTGWQEIDGKWYEFDDEDGSWVPSKQIMRNKAQSISSSTNWLILVDTSANRVGIFKGSRGNWTLYDFMKCSSGTSSTPTVKGYFSVTGKGYNFHGSDYTCYYYTQFYGNYLFHSTLYHKGTFEHFDNRLGMNLSHGCIRLAIDDAIWIYNNIPYGTRVYIY